MNEEDKYKKIDEFVEKNAIKRNNLRIYKPEDAIELIKLLEKQKVEIMGMDGFKIYEDNRIQPFMEYSNAYSNNEGNWEESIEFVTEVSEKDKEIIFELVYVGY